MKWFELCAAVDAQYLTVLETSGSEINLTEILSLLQFQNENEMMTILHCCELC